MRILLNCIHVVAALVMIVVVLLQQGKGADIGAAFGAGSSQTLFGSRGAGNFLTKMTTTFVIIFFCTSIWLSYLTTPKSVIEGIVPPPEENPATETTPATGETKPGETPSGFETIPAPEAEKKAPESGTAAPTSEAPAAPAAPAPSAAPTAPTPEPATPPASSGS